MKHIGKVASVERGALVNIVGCANAAGNSIPPLFVFRHIYFKPHFLEDAPVGSIGTANTSGWINDEGFLVFLKHFYQHTRCSKEKPCLLLLDNHESDISIESLNYSSDKGI